MKLAKRLSLIFVALIVFVVGLILVMGYSFSTTPYQGKVTDHFDGSVFTNPDGVRTDKGVFDIIKWMLARKPGAWEASSLEDFPYGEKPIERSDSLRITYVNHSTFLIQVDSMNILTDPIWGDRTSPLSFAGPKRMRPPGIDFDDLPPIDFVVISHNHYDHLDINTLERLKEKFDPWILTPLGVDLDLKERGFDRSIHLEWWSTVNMSARVGVHAVPAQHFSGRGLFDRNKSLWAGYVITTVHGNIYFAGDTGYGDFFKEIGNRFGPLKVALLPIGAYKPQWFMSPVHISPEEALQVHKDVKSEFTIGMHYGTFPLADDGQFDPENDLKKAFSEYNFDSSAFILLKEGKHIAF